MVSSFEGPFIGIDAAELVSDARWVDVQLPEEMSLFERAQLLETDGAVLVDACPGLARFVIPGGTCPPTVHVGVESEQPLVLQFRIDEVVPPAGEECGDIRKLHEFELRFADRVERTEVAFVVTP